MTNEELNEQILQRLMGMPPQVTSDQGRAPHQPMNGAIPLCGAACSMAGSNERSDRALQRAAPALGQA
jgi:hypothetical protein